MSAAASGLKKEFTIPLTRPGSSFETAARIPEISSGFGISLWSLNFSSPQIHYRVDKWFRVVGQFCSVR